MLALNVADAALVFQAMAGIDSVTMISSLRGLRIGIPRRFIADSVLTDARKPAFEHALQLLAQAGATVSMVNAHRYGEVRLLRISTRRDSSSWNTPCTIRR